MLSQRVKSTCKRLAGVWIICQYEQLIVPSERPAYTSKLGQFQSFRTTPLRGLLTADRAPFDTFAALICHGLFDRHPNLRIASIEMGSDWVRTLLKKLAKSFKQMPHAYSEDPLETFRRHCWVSPFQEENVREMGDLLGSDRLLMGSDWPHAEGIEEPSDYLRDLEGFSPDEVRLVMRENALALAERRPA